MSYFPATHQGLGAAGALSGDDRRCKVRHRNGECLEYWEGERDVTRGRAGGSAEDRERWTREREEKLRKAREASRCRYAPGQRVTNHREGKVYVADEDGCLVVDEDATDDYEAGSGSSDRVPAPGPGEGVDAMLPGPGAPPPGADLPGPPGGGGFDIPPVVMWGGAAAGAGLILFLVMRRR